MQLEHPDGNVGWSNVGPTSVLSYWRWDNVSLNFIAVWDVHNNGNNYRITQTGEPLCEFRACLFIDELFILKSTWKKESDSADMNINSKIFFI